MESGGGNQGEIIRSDLQEVRRVRGKFYNRDKV